jgi:hypothetical protein
MHAMGLFCLLFVDLIDKERIKCARLVSILTPDRHPNGPFPLPCPVFPAPFPGLSGRRFGNRPGAIHSKFAKNRPKILCKPLKPMAILTTGWLASEIHYLADNKRFILVGLFAAGLTGPAFI